jgi:hypothetical protein
VKVPENTVIPLERIANLILQLRGNKVILDSDLAVLYGVETKRLNQQVRRNIDRFPSDFMFQLTLEESDALKLQFATSKVGHGGRRKLPLAYTEHGALMAASVLNTKQAIQVSVFIVRAFVKMRDMLSTHKEIAHRLDDMERTLGEHDEAIKALIAAIRELMQPLQAKKLPEYSGEKVGFRRKRKK